MKVTVFMLVFFLISCSDQALPKSEVILTPVPGSVTLKLNWRHGIQFLGFYVAQEKGFYAEEGLIVDIEPLFEASEGTTIPARVADGEFDFGLAGTPRRLKTQQASGVSIIAISTILQLSPNTFFAQADSGIITPTNFKGHTIAVKNDNSRNNLKTLLTASDLTLDDVIIVDVGFDMTPFYEGDVEVWVGYLNDEVIRARQQGLELVTFPLHEYGIEDSAVTLFTSQELLESDPQLPEHFLRASLRGWQWAVDNPTEAVDLMLEIFPEMADERDFHLASFNAYIPLVRPPGIPIGTIDCKDWVSDKRFEALDSTENLCTTDIFEQAIAEKS